MEKVETLEREGTEKIELRRRKLREEGFFGLAMNGASIQEETADEMNEAISKAREQLGLIEGEFHV